MFNLILLFWCKTIGGYADADGCGWLSIMIQRRGNTGNIWMGFSSFDSDGGRADHKKLFV